MRPRSLDINDPLRPCSLRNLFLLIWELEAAQQAGLLALAVVMVLLRQLMRVVDDPIQKRVLSPSILPRNLHLHEQAVLLQRELVMIVLILWRMRARAVARMAQRSGVLWLRGVAVINYFLYLFL
jgi:hypothetical protein